MARVTDGEVAELIKVEDTDVLQAFIDHATLVVDEHLVGQGLSTKRLKLIELYLAAHFTALVKERGGLTRTRTGSSEDQWSDRYSAGFGLTRFGQSAMMLDTSNTLSDMAAIASDPKLNAVIEVV